MSSTAIPQSEVLHMDPQAVTPPVGEPAVTAGHAHGAGHLDAGDDAEGDLEGADSDSSIWENESMLEDILAQDADGFEFTDGQDAASPDVCTAAESLALRRRLRSVGVENFVAETLNNDSYSVRKLLTAFRTRVPSHLDDDDMLRLLGFALYREMSCRQRLEQYSTMEDAVELILRSENVLVITGAGISTSLGIPDFRSNGGFYQRLRAMGFEDPESVFTLSEFDMDPDRFFKLAGDLLPEPGKWSPTHQFIRILQDSGKLLRNYTQNIDNVESYAGLDPEKVIHCHGSWRTASCRKCAHKVPGQDIFPALRAKRIAYCPRCEANIAAGAGLKRKRSNNAVPKAKKKKGNSYGGDFDDDDDDDDEAYDIPTPGIMKPDITFFGENLPDTFYKTLNDVDRAKVDLIIVMGTSMKVAPVSEIPHHVPDTVPQMYISRDPVKHIEFDINLLGDCDVVTAELASRLGWSLKHPMVREGQQVLVKRNAKYEWAWDVKTRAQWEEAERERVRSERETAALPLNDSAVAGGGGRA